MRSRGSRAGEQDAEEAGGRRVKEKGVEMAVYGDEELVGRKREHLRVGT